MNTIVAAASIAILCVGVVWMTGACIVVAIEACAIAALFKNP